ncbi:cytochrome c-type biogenesis protein CcmH [Neiella sp. HB171785]|uniref:Cytochrome c-type biogenesis protein n=1 Tax=Neiella litorisoli TaxID=2771431 RepID=A0A8J6QJ30_9GAMM|nr:cytochrome c-type biogenesis protein [Neiella litorisoli]MBD1389828.1 cytochrome c-type biogenesis protein CcmH [Neiella litorisoli]
MSTLYRFCVALIAVIWAVSAQAAIDAYPFEDAAKEAQFRELINEIRCPKCQNQTISDSDAGLAKDLKDKTYEMVQQGASKQQVIDYMVQRYGDFVHYQPPIKQSTWVLWFGPFAFLLIAVVGVMIMIAKKRAPKAAAGQLTDAEKARLQELMKKDDSNS